MTEVEEKKHFTRKHLNNRPDRLPPARFVDWKEPFPPGGQFFSLILDNVVRGYRITNVLSLIHKSRSGAHELPVPKDLATQQPRMCWNSTLPLVDDKCFHSQI